MTATLTGTNLNERVYDELRARLLTRQEPAGGKLSLHALATQLGVSRSPVHHALTRLVAEGLLTVRPRRGYYVTPVTAEAVDEGYDVRLALELLAAERGLERTDDGSSSGSRSSWTQPTRRSPTRSGMPPTRPSTSSRLTSRAAPSCLGSTASSR